MCPWVRYWTLNCSWGASWHLAWQPAPSLYELITLSCFGQKHLLNAVNVNMNVNEMSTATLQDGSGTAHETLSCHSYLQIQKIVIRLNIWNKSDKTCLQIQKSWWDWTSGTSLIHRPKRSIAKHPGAGHHRKDPDQAIRDSNCYEGIYLTCNSHWVGGVCQVASPRSPNSLQKT